SVMPAVALHTEPLMAWPDLMVLTAAPVPPETLPVILIRVVPLAAFHLPRGFCVLKVIDPLVVPLPPDPVIVIVSLPEVPLCDANFPEPLPPVAAAGVQLDSVAVRTLFTVFVDSFVHLPGTAADAFPASGNASNDADAANTANART